jgi:hypothetical protein
MTTDHSDSLKLAFLRNPTLPENVSTGQSPARAKFQNFIGDWETHSHAEDQPKIGRHP